MMFRSKRSSSRDFIRDTSGSFMPLFAVLAIPMAMIIAMGVDYSNTVRLRQKLQDAADTAVLAASRLNDADSGRLAAAQRYFDAQIGESLKSQIINANFGMDNGANTITANISADIATFMPKAVTKKVMSINVRSAAAVAKPDVRQLDVVMCIDATGSMSATLNAVKNNALNFETNLNAELVRRGIPAYDAMRVRAIYYRDFGGTTLTGAATNVYVYINGSYTQKKLKAGDSDYWTYVGDTPPMKESGFFALPSQRSNFQSYVNPETAWGGGDLPESGLECVNSAMSSAWAKIGDIPAGGTKKIDAIYPLIVVWTDAAAHKPSYSLSIKNPNYPIASVMPRNYTDLLAKWNNSAVIDQSKKMLVFFGNPSLATNDNDGAADGWLKVKTWPGFMLGGTLTDGNTNMVSKIADAIASKVRTPTLTN